MGGGVLKRAMLKISDVLLVDILKGLQEGPPRRFKVASNGLPADAKPIRAGHTPDGNLFILIESEEFEDIELGKEYPILRPPCLLVVDCAATNCDYFQANAVLPVTL